jgi:hypothetical protein
MMKYIKLVCSISLLMQVFTMQSAWFIVAIDNNSDLTYIKAARNGDIEIPSISQILIQSIGQKTVFLSADALFGSLGGCKIMTINKQGQSIGLLFFGDPTYRVANGRAEFADLASRNAAAMLRSSMMARVVRMLADGSTKLVGFAGYEEKNQPIALNLQGVDGDYRVDLQLIK